MSVSCILRLTALSALMLLAGCNASTNDSGNGAATSSAPPVAAVKPPAGQDWLTTVGATPDGGFMKGNPAAPVKLVEYFSPSCPHCKHFADESRTELNAAVSSGRLSYEMRPLLLPHPHDPALDVLARCGGASAFFPITEAMFAQQDDIYTKLEAAAKDNQAKWQAMAPEAAYADMADKLGLITMVEGLGVSATKAKACLADKNNYTALQNIANVSDQKYHISGTPSFLINDSLANLSETEDVWKALKAQLHSAGAL